MTMKQFTEEYGARNDILRQAVFYPPEGLSYGEFLKVLLPPQQAVGRRLLQQGYLIRNEAMRIILSPIVKKELHLQPVWDENTHAFLTRLVLCLAEAIITSRKADKWAEQAHSDPEQLRMLVFQHSRENLPPFQMQLAREALSLYSKGQTLTVVPGSKREFLVSATIAIEKYQQVAKAPEPSRSWLDCLRDGDRSSGKVGICHRIKRFALVTPPCAVLAAC